MNEQCAHSFCLLDVCEREREFTRTTGAYHTVSQSTSQLVNQSAPKIASRDFCEFRTGYHKKARTTRLNIDNR